MIEKVVSLRPTPPESDGDDLGETVRARATAVEELNVGLKLMIDVITGHDKRLRALELEIRKIQRRNVPVIVNSHGQPVN